MVNNDFKLVPFKPWFRPGGVFGKGRILVTIIVIRDKRVIMGETKQYDLPEKKDLGKYPSRVGNCYGLTRNLQNFESARIDAWGEDFCHPDQKKDTMRVISKLCWDHVYESASHIEKFIEKKRILDQQNQYQGGLG